MGRKLEELRPQICIAPTVGLEPATTRSGALPSADRTRRAVISERRLEIRSEHLASHGDFCQLPRGGGRHFGRAAEASAREPMGSPRVGSNPTGVVIACPWLLPTAFFVLPRDDCIRSGHYRNPLQPSWSGYSALARAARVRVPVAESEPGRPQC